MHGVGFDASENGPVHCPYEPAHLQVSRNYRYDRYAGLLRQRGVVETENVIAIVPNCACLVLTPSSASEGSATHRPLVTRPHGASS